MKKAHNIKLEKFDRGDGTISLVSCKKAKAFKILFKGMTPLEIAMELSLKWIGADWHFWAFKRTPEWVLPYKDPAQLTLNLWP